VPGITPARALLQGGKATRRILAARTYLWAGRIQFFWRLTCVLRYHSLSTPYLPITEPRLPALPCALTSFRGEQWAGADVEDRDSRRAGPPLFCPRKYFRAALYTNAAKRWRFFFHTGVWRYGRQRVGRRRRTSPLPLLPAAPLLRYRADAVPERARVAPAQPSLRGV